MLSRNPIPPLRVFGPIGAWILLSLAPSLGAVDEAYGPVIAREVVSSGLNSPLYVTTPPHDSRYLFILEKGGSIRVFDRVTESIPRRDFLSLSVSTDSERGLLGLAFHPDFTENRLFYVNFTNPDGDTVVRRYRTETAEAPYSVEAGSELDLLTVPQPFANHNAGWIAFSPVDGYLYVSLGDGGSGNDPEDNGQDTGTLLGSMLRLDVDGDDFPDDPDRNYAIPPDNPFVGEDGRDEIWAYGLRNPWRDSFDRETGDLWIADVGQSNREEVNFQPAASEGGENYGWRLREGTIATPTGGVGGSRPPGNVDPVYEYDFSDGRKSISGGYVYRGEAMPQLEGHYFLADFVAEFIRSFPHDGSGMVEAGDVVDWTDQFGNIASPTSFGEDADGELYIVSFAGSVYQITQSPWYLWRNRHFSDEEIRDSSISGPAATIRGDGVPNLLKHALGLDPNEPRGRLPIDLAVEATGDDEYLTLTVDRDPAATDVALRVEAADSPDPDADWTASGVVVLDDGPDRLRVRDSVPLSEAGRRFFRLRAEAAFQGE